MVDVPTIKNAASDLADSAVTIRDNFNSMSDGHIENDAKALVTDVQNRIKPKLDALLVALNE
jgi:hypothetical protein